MSDIDELLSIRAAELYYEENQTQDEIGVILRLTRWKVGRLLASAKANGFIRIEIVHPRARRLPIERRLRESTGLPILGSVSMNWTDHEKAKRKRSFYAFGASLAILVTLYAGVMARMLLTA